MKAYWAHSKKIYDTPLEKEILSLLEQVFDEVVCPNRDIGEKGDIKPYLDEIDGCDVVVVSEFDGFVGKGAFEEIRHALKTIDVYVLRNWELVGVAGVKGVDPNDWAVKYGRLVTDLREVVEGA